MQLENGHVLERVRRVSTPVPFPPQHIHSYLILADEPILIDTGMRTPPAWEAIQKNLGEHGLKVSDIRHLLITHAHIDHYGQAKRIREASGCKVYSNVLEATYLRSGREGGHREMDSPNMAWFYEWGVPQDLIERDVLGHKMSEKVAEAVPVDVTFDDGEKFTICDVTFRPVWVPGHAIGHTVYIVDEWKTMFSADHLLPDISPVPLLNFPDPKKRGKTRSLIEFLESLKKIEHEDIIVALPAHGDPILDHQTLIDGYRLGVDRRMLRVKRALTEDGPMTAFELSEHMFRQKARMMMYLTMSEAVGYLEILESEDKLAIENREGVLYYSLKS